MRFQVLRKLEVGEVVRLLEGPEIDKVHLMGQAAKYGSAINPCIPRSFVGQFVQHQLVSFQTSLGAFWCILMHFWSCSWMALSPSAPRKKRWKSQRPNFFRRIRAWPDWRRSASRTQLWGELKIAVATADVYGYLPSRKWWLKKQNMFHQTFRIVQLPKYGELPKQETNCLLFFSHGPLCQFFPVYDLANRDGMVVFPISDPLKKHPFFVIRSVHFGFHMDCGCNSRGKGLFPCGKSGFWQLTVAEWGIDWWSR